MGSHPFPDFSGFIARLSSALEDQGLTFMLIGGQAVLLHGRPRLTEDIDVTLGATPDRLPDVLAVSNALTLKPLPEEPERFARETFVLPVRHGDTGIRVDFIFSTTPYERQELPARCEWMWAGGMSPSRPPKISSFTLFAGRAQDWEDAVSVVRRQRNAID